MVPSLKTLSAAFGPEKGKILRKLLREEVTPREVSPRAAKWADSCFHAPDERGEEMVMEAANEIIGGYGVEAISGRWNDHYHQELQLSYVNLGDTYTTTLVCDLENMRFQVTSWGDWFETHERERELR